MIHYASAEPRSVGTRPVLAGMLLFMAIGCQSAGNPAAAPEAELEETASQPPATSIPDVPTDGTISYRFIDGNVGWTRDSLTLSTTAWQADYSWYESAFQSVTLAEEEGQELQALFDSIPFESLSSSMEPLPGEDAYAMDYQATLPDGTSTVKTALLASTAEIPETVRETLDTIQALIASSFAAPSGSSYLYEYEHVNGYSGKVDRQLEVDALTGILRWQVSNTSGETIASAEDIYQLTALLEATPFYMLESGYGNNGCCDIPSSTVAVREGSCSEHVTVYGGLGPLPVLALILASEAMVEKYSHLP